MRRVIGGALFVLAAAGGATAATSELADAAMRQNREAVRSLLQRKANVNAPQVDGTTALYWALRLDDHVIADMLIRGGANAIIALAVARAPAIAQSDAPWFGAWELDVARSTYVGPPPYRRATCVIEPWEDGLKSICDMVRVRGGVTHLEWAGRFDGRDYAVQGVEEYVTYAYRRRDDRSYDVVIKLDGKEAGRSRVTVSADGRTMTVVTRQGREETSSVYRRK